MIIVSQDKDKVVNFDNVGNINIEKCYNESLKQEDFTYDILVYIISSGIVRLGKYKTEERAKEVLQEIGERYEGWQNLVYGQPSGICNPKYEMPEK